MFIIKNSLTNCYKYQVKDMSMTVVLFLTLVCISQSTCAIDSAISDYMDLNQVILPANITVTLNISTPTATINNYSIFYAMSGLSLIPKGISSLIQWAKLSQVTFFSAATTVAMLRTTRLKQYPPLILCISSCLSYRQLYRRNIHCSLGLFR